MGARVSLYSYLEVLGTEEAKLERLNRVKTPGLGFLSKQGLLAESGDRIAEYKVQTPRLISLLLGELVLQLAESKAKMHKIKILATRNTYLEPSATLLGRFLADTT